MLPARLASRLQRTDAGCLEWTGYRNRQGYGQVKWQGRLWPVHKLVWTLTNGPVPDGLVVDHQECDNPPCAEVSHLAPKPRGANTLRGVGPTAVNKRKTECKNGHPLEGDNVRVERTGSRRCLTCQRAYNAAYKRRVTVRPT